MSKQPSDPICTVERWDADVEVFAASGKFIAHIRLDDGTASERSFDSVTDCLRSLGVVELEAEMCVTVTLKNGAGVTEADVVILALESSPEFEPSGTKLDLTDDPPLRVNDRSFMAIGFDDGTWELVEGADDYTTIASAIDIEMGSMTSGSNTHVVGRLPTGHVFLLEDIDEDPGSTLALRATMSNVDAVITWLDRLDPYIDFARLLKAEYRDGRIIGVGANLDEELTSSLELSCWLDLREDELTELWSRLPDE
jgi:hypothetical protein